MFLLETKKRYGTRAEVTKLERDVKDQVNAFLSPDLVHRIVTLGEIRKEVNKMVRNADKAIGVGSRPRKREKHRLGQGLR